MTEVARFVPSNFCNSAFMQDWFLTRKQVLAFGGLLRPKPFGVIRGPFGMPKPFARPGLPWLRASNPNAHEGEEEVPQVVEVVHSPDQVEDIDIPELLPLLVGFYNEDGTIQELVPAMKSAGKSRRKRFINVGNIKRSAGPPSGFLIDSFEVSTSSDRQVSSGLHS